MFFPGRGSKKLVKEASKGWISKEYIFDGMTFYVPAHHISQFYEFLYLCSVGNRFPARRKASSEKTAPALLSLQRQMQIR